MAEERAGDILGKQSSNKNTTNNKSNRASNFNKEATDTLKSIDNTLKAMLAKGGMSQSAARDAASRQARGNNSKWEPNRSRSKSSSFNRKVSNSSSFDSFIDGLEGALLESVLGPDFKNKMSNTVAGFADAIGVEVSEIPKLFGQEIGKKILSSKIGEDVSSKLSRSAGDAASKLKSAFMSGVDRYQDQNPTAGGGNLRGKFESIFNYKPPTEQSQSEARAEAESPENKEFKESVDDFSDAVNRFNQSKEASSKVKDAVNKKVPEASDKVSEAEDLADKANKLKDAAATATGAKEAATKIAGDTVAKKGAEAAAGSAISGAAEVAEASEMIGAALSGLSGIISAVGWPLLALVAGFMILDKALEQLGPAIDGTEKLFSAMGKAANRYQASRKENLKYAQERIEADVKTMIETPFDILQEAAQKLYDAWDSSLRTITGTQGYTKDDLYSLMGQYANRLREEGLTRVVSTSDITENLVKVLESGLSGKGAEEFAYLATKLNAAVPTQDFFGYADTYASIVANAIKDGKSQSEAIANANSQMESFASNVLYASRELAGGFTTGLNNASDLFSESVRIAQAAKTNNATEISGVLTSISAIVGAIAPDLSSSIVSAVVSAATGGNSSQLVALRSLAGINASNTEFLNALAKDPKSIFTSLFRTLASYQNMSDSYMESAEGLADIFGLSIDAFARVDFNYLADAISAMNTNNRSLDENMKLLQSGETTTSIEQMRMEQINQYMLDEGLSYVLDNQAARAIQQHMWDEQRHREALEATYAVELRGAALEFLEGIKSTVDNVLNFINPFSFVKKAANLVATEAEMGGQRADIKQFLELGKVGKGNKKDLYNLTTTNQDLKLTSSLVEMMGGFSLYEAAHRGLAAYNKYDNISGWLDGRSALKGAITSSILNEMQGSSYGDISSKYSWASVSKSTAQALQASALGSNLDSPTLRTTSAQSAIKSSAASNFQKYLDSMNDYISDNQREGKKYSYDGWKASATKYGIKDVSSALEDYGLSENDLQSKFNEAESYAAAQYEHERDMREDEFWEQGKSFFLNTQESWLNWEKLITDNQMSQIVELQKSNVHLTHLNTWLSNFVKAWNLYYVEHTAYSKATNDAYNVAGVIRAEKGETGDAVLALAKALTLNDNSLKDPVVQTNVLLSQILIVLESIMQQNNQTGELSLPDALSALGLGVVNTSKKKK